MSDSSPPPVQVVFGATGGIGSELSRRLAHRGGRVILVARRQERLQALAAELGATAHAADATRSAEVDLCIEHAIGAHGRLDGGLATLRPPARL